MAKKRPKAANKNDGNEFAKLFWAARREQRQLKTAAKLHDPACRTAVEFARDRNWAWAETLLEASRLDLASAPQDAIALLAEAGSEVPDHWRGLLDFVRASALQRLGKNEEAATTYQHVLADGNFYSPGAVWCNLGLIYSDKGQLDEAIDAYQRALRDTNDTDPGITWRLLGNAYKKKNKPSEAINAYHNALTSTNYTALGDTWSDLAYVYGEQGDYEKASQAYKQALTDTNYNDREHAWNGLAVCQAFQGKHKEAIELYLKALAEKNHDDTARIWANLAEAYVEISNPILAKEAFQKALETPDPTGNVHARARLGLQTVSAKIEKDALSADDRAIISPPRSGLPTETIEAAIISAIRDAGDTQYDKYLRKMDSDRNNTLSILRGWSSAVTLMEGSERRWRGGGYFLKWRGFGVVLDPGFDFLRNFHDAGYHAREIHAVLVSHNHPDHNSDVKDIDDLRYEIFKRTGLTGSGGGKPYVLLWDQDTNGATSFGNGKPQHRHEPITFSYGFPQPMDLRSHACQIPLRVTPFQVKHSDDVPHAMGMVLELFDEDGNVTLRLGYTADTGYFENLDKHLSNCDVVIAHISQPGIDELQDEKTLKEVHLGYRGTAQLLKECKPTLALIGEFWAGFTDSRIALVKGLRQRSGLDAILPTGLALHLRLPSLEIECTECEKPIPFSDIKVAPPADQFGSLAYLCNHCLIG
jgi:tetratricopeptide (TPR) repeat protein